MKTELGYDKMTRRRESREREREIVQVLERGKRIQKFVAFLGKCVLEHQCLSVVGIREKYLKYFQG